jgi:hypothetical protein
MSKKVEVYSLYQTLSVNIPKKPLTENQQKTLRINIVKKLNDDQRIAILKLIVEHARIEDGYDGDIQNLPYGGKIKNDEVTIDFGYEDLPIKLQHILWKFLDVCDEGEE